jgi:diketogulonate reductase-like aldo/keto reductase
MSKSKLGPLPYIPFILNWDIKNETELLFEYRQAKRRANELRNAVEERLSEQMVRALDAIDDEESVMG